MKKIVLKTIADFCHSFAMNANIAFNFMCSVYIWKNAGKVVFHGVAGRMQHAIFNLFRFNWYFASLVLP
jgi:hypothetical protein